MTDEVILRNRSFLLDKKRRSVVLMLLFGMVVVPVFAIWFIFEQTGQDRGVEALRLVLEHFLGQISAEAFARDPFDAAATFVFLTGFPLYLVYFYLASRFERLTLSSAGIRYTSPLPDAFRFLRPDWYLPWEQVTQAALKLPGYGIDTQQAVLTLITRGGNRKLRPAYWVNSETWTPPGPWRFTLRWRVTAERQTESLLEAELIARTRLQVKAFRIDRSPQLFQLEDNSWSYGMAVFLLALLGYALVDTFVLKTESWAGQPPYGIYAVGAVPVALAGYYRLDRAGVPRYVCIGLALLTGLAFGAALHPALLRLNQMTDRAGLKTYRFERQVDGRYLPQEAGPPPLRMMQPPGYWAQFRAGSTHDFSLRKGGLGIWQFDEVPLRDAYRAYFDRIRQAGRNPVR